MEAEPVLLSQLASTIPISITEIVQDYNFKKSKENRWKSCQCVKPGFASEPVNART